MEQNSGYTYEPQKPTNVIGWVFAGVFVIALVIGVIQLLKRNRKREKI